MIRQATAADASRIAEILVFGKRAAYRSIFQNDAFSFGALQVLPLANEYLREPRLLDGIRVYDDGIVKGMMNARAQVYIAEILELYVDPFFVRMGVGRALMEAFLESAARTGARRAELWVLRENSPARRFYERLGFAPDGRARYAEGTTVWEIGYARSLADAIL